MIDPTDGLDSPAGPRYTDAPSRNATSCAVRQAEVSMTERTAASSRASLASRLPTLLGALALALGVGCHPLGFLRTNKERVPETPTREKPERGPEKAKLPSRYEVRVAPVLFFTDFKVHSDLPMFAELAKMRDRIQAELKLPPTTETIRVYLFETEQAYKRYLRQKYPELYKLDRRAFFVAERRGMGMGEDLLVFTYDSKRLVQDLRHELTHALLHGVIREVPQWLDEGLAEYFELPPGKENVNAEHVERLRADLLNRKVRLSLSRLERLQEVHQMHPAEYRESWAWVYLMLRGGKPEAKQVLLQYLHQLRVGKHPGDLAPRLEKVFNSPEEALTALLARLDADLARARADARK